LIHAKILAGLQKELQNKYEISSTIRHKGERGRSRETGVARFLRENLPDAYGVGTGELFSFSGEGLSPQCDIIIYDRMKTPVFGKQEAVQQIPIEAVYVVIEVRSILDTHALQDAALKFEAIRSLWHSSHPPKRGKKNDNGPAFCLFGFKRKCSERAFINFLKGCDTDECEIVALDSGCSIWIHPTKRSKLGKPAWIRTTTPKSDAYYTLAFFFFSMLGCCQENLEPLDTFRILLRVAEQGRPFFILR
jgi:hypothetical protein